MFDIASTYAGILQDPDHLKPPAEDAKYLFMVHDMRSYLDFYLSPDEIEPLFADHAIYDVLEMFHSDVRLAIRCVNGAMLENERHETFGLSVGSALDPKRDKWYVEYTSPWLGTGIDTRAVVKWLAVARILQQETGFALFSRLAQKSTQQLKR